EEGQIHETLNLAALHRLPLLFVCENNQYSSHLHWTERRLADNLERAGEFHSVPGCRVDGNDVEAIYASARAAVERARAGEGPALLECRTFRWRGHVGASADLDVGVHRRGDLADWLSRDPVERAAHVLGDLSAERTLIENQIEMALARARAGPQ